MHEGLDLARERIMTFLSDLGLLQLSHWFETLVLDKTLLPCKLFDMF